MKILLLNPPFNPEDSVGESRSVRFVLNVTPPLGQAYLGAALRKEGHTVQIVDYTANYPYPSLETLLKNFNPDLVGLTATTPSFPGTRSFAETILQLAPQTKIVLGGAHATACPQNALQGGQFAVVVRGEGEETMKELLQIHPRKWSREYLKQIQGIAFLDEASNCHLTTKRPYIKDLDSLPLPALDLLPPLKNYHPTPASYRKLPVGIIMTSRGCPNQCTFCDRTIFGNTTRFHGTKRVLDEIERMINEYGAREIRFFDDTFTLKKDRTRKICQGLRDRKINIPWTCLTAVRSVDAELLKEMKKAGCWQVLFGLESGDDRMLKLLKKGNTVEHNRKAVRWARQAGLEVRGDFIVGTPGETIHSLEATLDFAIKEKLDYAHFNKFTPFPGTQLYRDLIEQGYVFDFEHGCSILDHGALLYVPTSLNPDEYRRWLDQAFKKFYLRPGHIFRRLKAIRTWPQFKGQVRGAFSIAKL